MLVGVSCIYAVIRWIKILTMTLQKLLLKLSKNKSISVECFCADEKCTITLKEWYNFNELLKVEINLNKKINANKFLSFL